MKKSIPAGMLMLALSLSVISGVGCAAKSQHPIHPGAVSVADSNVYDTLMTCQAAIEQAKVEFGRNPSAKPVLNGAIVSYNTALDGYLAFKAGKSNDLASVQAQLVNLVSDIAALERQFGTGVRSQ